MRQCEVPRTNTWESEGHCLASSLHSGLPGSSSVPAKEVAFYDKSAGAIALEAGKNIHFSMKDSKLHKHLPSTVKGLKLGGGLF